MQLVGDKHVIAEHFNAQCNIGSDLHIGNNSRISSALQDTSNIRPSIISSKEQLPMAENAPMPLTNNITSVITNKEEIKNSSIPGSSVMTRQEQLENSSISGSSVIIRKEQLVVSNIPGTSPVDKFITQEELPEDESSLPGTCDQQMGRNYSCGECDYVAKLPHHLRVILFYFVNQCFSN